jgi:hypothetical protein
VPDLEKEIRSALRLEKNYDEIISAEEANNEISLTARDSLKAHNNWDCEF